MNNNQRFYFQSSPRATDNDGLLPGIKCLFGDFEEFVCAPNCRQPSIQPPTFPMLPPFSEFFTPSPVKRSREYYEVYPHQQYIPSSPELSLKKRRINNYPNVDISPSISNSTPSLQRPPYMVYPWRQYDKPRSSARPYNEHSLPPSRLQHTNNGLVTPESVKQIITERLFSSSRAKSKPKSYFLPNKAVKKLKKWFFLNVSHPYPSYAEKEQLAKETGLTHSQVSNWFTNSRKRMWVQNLRAAEGSSREESTK